MRHCRTWISKHREDQKDITCLCLFMALLLVFHYVIRYVSLFVMCTLEEPPARLTLENQNLPHEVINGFVLISCLFLVCSAVHLAGTIRRRLTIKLIALSLVVSSCCLIANSTTLRRILKSAAPESISILDPQTLIFDIDRRGWLSFHNFQMDLAMMNKVLEHRLKQRSSTPIIICPDRRTPFSAVWSVVGSCRAAGATDISLAEQTGFDRYPVPAFNGKTIPSDIETNRISTVLIGRDYFELNGRREKIRDMANIMNTQADHQTVHWYRIILSDDAPYVAVTILLNAFQDYDATNVVWESLQ